MQSARYVGRAIAASVMALAALFMFTGIARPRASGPDGAVVDLLNRYARGDFDGVTSELERVTDFKSFAKDFRANATRWIGGNADGIDRRRLVAATVALEASKIDVERFRLLPPGEFETATPTAPLLGWSSDLLRSVREQTPAERWWRLAVIALVERARDGYMLSGFLPASTDPRRVALVRAQHESAVDLLGRARERFPDEQRFRLAAVYDEEANRTLNWGVFLAEVPLRGPDRVVARDPAMWHRIVDRYDELARENDSIRGEAFLRGGLIALRLGDDTGAIDRWKRAETSTADDAIVYLSRLFAGKALERLDRPSDAESSYRSALQILPHVQSASASLGLLLFLRGDRPEAAALVQAAVSRVPADDPWRSYNYGDWRLWPTFIKHLREALR